MYSDPVEGLSTPVIQSELHLSHSFEHDVHRVNVELIFVLRITIILLFWEFVLNWQIETPILQLHVFCEELFEVLICLNRVNHLQEFWICGASFILIIKFLDLLLSSKFFFGLLII